MTGGLLMATQLESVQAKPGMSPLMTSSGSSPGPAKIQQQREQWMHGSCCYRVLTGCRPQFLCPCCKAGHYDPQIIDWGTDSERASNLPTDTQLSDWQSQELNLGLSGSRVHSRPICVIWPRYWSKVQGAGVWLIAWYSAHQVL